MSQNIWIVHQTISVRNFFANFVTINALLVSWYVCPSMKCGTKTSSRAELLLCIPAQQAKVLQVKLSSIAEQAQSGKFGFLPIMQLLKANETLQGSRGTCVVGWGAEWYQDKG